MAEAAGLDEALGRPLTKPWREIDLTEGVVHDHPDIRTDRQYLVKIGGDWFFGRFTRQHFGLNFTNWGTSGLQFDVPGQNSSQWERIVEIDPEKLHERPGAEDHSPDKSTAAEMSAAVANIDGTIARMAQLAKEARGHFRNAREALRGLHSDVDRPIHATQADTRRAPCVEKEEGPRDGDRPSGKRHAWEYGRSNSDDRLEAAAAAIESISFGEGIVPLGIEGRKAIARAVMGVLEDFPIVPDGYALVPHKPSRGRLVSVSMALRNSHACSPEKDRGSGGDPERAQPPADMSRYESEPIEHWADRAVAAEKRVRELERALAVKDEALRPFAEFADDMDADGRGLGDDEGIYAFKAGYFRKARSAVDTVPETVSESARKRTRGTPKRYDLFQVHLCGQNARGEMRESAEGEYVDFDSYERAARWRARCLAVISLIERMAEQGAKPGDKDWAMIREFQRQGAAFDPSLDDLVQKALSEAREVVDACAGDNRPAPEWAKRVRNTIDAAIRLSPRSEWVDTVMEDAVVRSLEPSLFSKPESHEKACAAVREAVRLSCWAVNALPENLFTHKDAWRRALGILRDMSDPDDKSYWEHEINAYDRTFSTIESLRPAAGPAPFAVVEALRNLERVAIGQREYFFKEQMEYPSIETFLDEEGFLNLPEDISPLLHQNHYNGRYSEADWWVKTIGHVIAEATAGAKDG